MSAKLVDAREAEMRGAVIETRQELLVVASALAAIIWILSRFESFMTLGHHSLGYLHIPMPVPVALLTFIASWSALRYFVSEMNSWRLKHHRRFGAPFSRLAKPSLLPSLLTTASFLFLRESVPQFAAQSAAPAASAVLAAAARENGQHAISRVWRLSAFCVATGSPWIYRGIAASKVVTKTVVSSRTAQIAVESITRCSSVATLQISSFLKNWVPQAVWDFFAKMPSPPWEYTFSSGISAVTPLWIKAEGLMRSSMTSLSHMTVSLTSDEKYENIRFCVFYCGAAVVMYCITRIILTVMSFIFRRRKSSAIFHVCIFDLITGVWGSISITTIIRPLLGSFLERVGCAFFSAMMAHLMDGDTAANECNQNLDYPIHLSWVIIAVTSIICLGPRLYSPIITPHRRLDEAVSPLMVSQGASPAFPGTVGHSDAEDDYDDDDPPLVPSEYLPVVSAPSADDEVEAAVTPATSESPRIAALMASKDDMPTVAVSETTPQISDDEPLLENLRPQQQSADIDLVDPYGDRMKLKQKQKRIADSQMPVMSLEEALASGRHNPTPSAEALERQNEKMPSWFIPAGDPIAEDRNRKASSSLQRLRASPPIAKRFTSKKASSLSRTTELGAGIPMGRRRAPPSGMACGHSHDFLPPTNVLGFFQQDSTSASATRRKTPMRAAAAVLGDETKDTLANSTLSESRRQPSASLDDARRRLKPYTRSETSPGSWLPESPNGMDGWGTAGRAAAAAGTPMMMHQQHPPSSNNSLLNVHPRSASGSDRVGGKVMPNDSNRKLKRISYDSRRKRPGSAQAPIRGSTDEA